MKFLIAPKSYHQGLINEYRSKDSFADIKLLTKEDLALFCVPQIKEEALIYLIHEKHFSYEEACMYLEYIPYSKCNIDHPKINFLSSLYDELDEKGLIIINSVPRNFADASFDIFGYSSNDVELRKFISLIKPQSSLFYGKKSFDFTCANLAGFASIESEVMWVLNKIAAEIKSGVSINNIKIMYRNSEYDYYFESLSMSYGFKVQTINSETWDKSGCFAEFIKIYDTNNSVDESLIEIKNIMKDDPLLDDFKKVVLSLKNDALTFNEQKDLFIGSLKHIKMPKKKYSNVVEVINNPSYCKGTSVYVLGFSQGLFPKSFKDDKFLDDKILRRLNILDSKAKSMVDFETLNAFFDEDKTLTITFAKKTASGQHHISPMLKFKIMDKTKEIDDTYYSKKALSYIYSDSMDAETFFHEGGEKLNKIRDVIELDYNTYNNQIKGNIKAFDNDSEIKLSTTSLDTFNSCPYKYYLDKVLKFEENDDTTNLDIGSLCHSILERSIQQNFDFDKEFDRELSNYKFKTSTLFILKNSIKEQLREAVNAIKERNKYTVNPEIETEQSYTYLVSQNTTLVGKIDFAEVIDKESYVIVDYKTGSKKFDDKKFDNGVSTQLPTYALLCQNSNKYKEYKLAGFYINNILTSSNKDLIKGENLIPDYLKLNGKTINNPEMFAKFDATVADGKSSFVSGIAMKGNEFRQVKSLISEETLNSYISRLIEYYLIMNSRLRNNDFKIEPLTFSDSDSPCSYCPYKDICYVRPFQYKKPKVEEDEDE